MIAAEKIICKCHFKESSFFFRYFSSFAFLISMFTFDIELIATKLCFTNCKQTRVGFFGIFLWSGVSQFFFNAVRLAGKGTEDFDGKI